MYGSVSAIRMCIDNAMEIQPLIKVLILSFLEFVGTKASVTLENFEIQPVCKDTLLLHPRVKVLEDVGIIKCADQCLGNTFCLSFYYRKSSRTCVLNAFRLPVGVNPPDAVPSLGFNIYTSKYKVVSYPSTCAEIQTHLNTSADGEYWLYPKSSKMLGNRAKVYCHDMGTVTPSEYVSLGNTNFGNYPATSQWGCSGPTPLIGPARPGVTTFTKIRCVPDDMFVDRAFYVFAQSTTNDYNMYGQASDCYNEYKGPQTCGPVGTFHMDTRNTGLIIDTQLGWSGYAWKPYPPQVTRSEGGTVIDLLCGGFCGGCAPTLPSGRKMYLYYNPRDRLQDDKAFPVDIASSGA